MDHKQSKVHLEKHSWQLWNTGSWGQGIDQGSPMECGGEGGKH